MTDEPPRRLTSTLGLVLCRIVVPLWIVTGGTFKLVEANPGLMPRGILDDAVRLGLNLDSLLATLISLEYFAALVILFLGRFARTMAIFMMSAFVLILTREIAAGRTNCGCFGAASPSPWVMIAVDGAMLLGLVFLKPAAIAVFDRARWPLAVVAALTAAATAVSFVTLIPAA